MIRPQIPTGRAGPSEGYVIRMLRGHLELDFPGRAIETPRSPGLIGPLVLLALNAGRELSLTDFKMQLHDSDHDLVTTAQIRTPISRLRGAGFPIPPRRYLLDVVPSAIDIVDFDRRAKEFIDLSIGPERLSDDELSAVADLGSELHDLWQHDPAAAVGHQPRLSDLFARHRIRNRRFGLLYIRLLTRMGERDRAEDILEQYIGRYGTDESFVELERGLRRPAVQHPGEANDLTITALPGPAAEGTALAELRERIAATSYRPLAQLVVGDHHLDLIHTVERVAVDHEIRCSSAVEAPGGAAANTAVALARLGHPVAAAGIVVADRAGTLLHQSLSRAGVDTRMLLQLPQQSNARTGRHLIFVDPLGGRAVFVEPGANDEFARTLNEHKSARDQLDEIARESRMVNLTAFSGDAERRLQEDLVADLPDDVIVSFAPGDPCSTLGLDRLTALIMRCDILRLGEGHLRTLVENSSALADTPSGRYRFRDTVEALFRWRAARAARPLMLVVRRERGSPTDLQHDVMTIAVGRQSVETMVSAYTRSAEPRAMDITGSHDAIAAAVHLGLLSGAPLDECADLAFVFANEACSEIGARTGLPDRSTIERAWSLYFPHTEVPVWVPRA